MEGSSTPERRSRYFDIADSQAIRLPSMPKVVLSRLALPILALISREQSLKLRLTPLDDERVIMALRHTKGKVLDVGCGANNFVRSYGNGVGVDVFPWEGADEVIKDAAKLPFKDGSFDTVSYLACLNHIPNRDDSLKDAYRVMKPGGRLLVTMIPPRWGQFIHWLRFRNDPDHQDRDIDHNHELLGMHPALVRGLMRQAGFKNISRKRFAFGINSLYIGEKPRKSKSS